MRRPKFIDLDALERRVKDLYWDAYALHPGFGRAGRLRSRDLRRGIGDPVSGRGSRGLFIKPNDMALNPHVEMPAWLRALQQAVSDIEFVVPGTTLGPGERP